METEISKDEDKNSLSLTVRQELKLFRNKGERPEGGVNVPNKDGERDV